MAVRADAHEIAVILAGAMVAPAHPLLTETTEKDQTCGAKDDRDAARRARAVTVRTVTISKRRFLPIGVLLYGLCFLSGNRFPLLGKRFMVRVPDSRKEASACARTR